MVRFSVGQLFFLSFATARPALGPHSSFCPTDTVSYPEGKTAESLN
jgi:hypothetical protein